MYFEKKMNQIKFFIIIIILSHSFVCHAQDTINARVSDDYRIHPIFRWVKCKNQKEQENTSTLNIDCQDFYRLNMLVDDSILFELKMPERNSPLSLTNIPAGKHSVLIWERSKQSKAKSKTQETEATRYRYEFTSTGNSEIQKWELPLTEKQKRNNSIEAYVSLTFLLLSLTTWTLKNF